MNQKYVLKLLYQQPTCLMEFRRNFMPVCFAETFWSLKHFSHLSHSCIKTRHNSIHWSMYSDIVTELAMFFRSIKKNLVCKKN